MKKPRLAILLALLCAALPAAPFGDDAPWEARRKALLDKPRQVLYNTDGCDAAYFGLAGNPDKEPTPENFKKERFAFCLGTETKVLSYCVTLGGFGHTLYDSKVGTPYLSIALDSEKARNVLGDLLKQGTDPMQLAVDFCREHDLECFACLRMNDTHDGGHTPQNPSPFWSPFKENHPDALFSNHQRRPPYCTWTAVDYGHPAVQAYVTDLVQELCDRYDVDGFEYDFMRHTQYFRSVAFGGHATDAEREALTGVVRKMRAITEAAGHAKGRPILVAVRVPDSVEYCRNVGIDIEQWLSEGLVDMLITTSYFQLNPWSYTAELAHRHGAKAYASMDESRIRSNLPMGKRGSLPSYQAQIASATAQSVDGIYVFNMEYGGLAARAFASHEALRNKDKVYYATYRGSGGYVSGGYVRNGELLNNMPNIDPGLGGTFVAPDGVLQIPIFIGDDLDDQAPDAKRAVVTVQMQTPPGCDFQATANGTPLTLDKRRSKDGILTFSVPPAVVHKGDNLFTVAPLDAPKAFRTFMAVRGDRLLVGSLRGVWRRFYLAEKDAETIVDGAYQLKDTTSDNHTAAALYYPLPQGEGGRLKVSVAVRLVSSTEPDGAVLRLANGRFVEKVTFEAGKVSLAVAGKSAPFDTTGAFHVYEAIMGDGEFVLTADGQELLRAPLTGDTRKGNYDMVGYTESIPGLNTRGVVIGSITGPGQGTMQWKDMTVQQDAIPVLDFAVGISYIDPPSQELLALRDAPIRPLASVNAANGKLTPSEGVVNRYAANGFLPDLEGVILMHRQWNHGPLFDFAQALPLAEPPRHLVAEFTARVLEDGAAGEPGLLFVLAPARPEKENQVWEFDLRLGTRDIICNALPGAINYANLDMTKDMTFRVAMDTQTGEAVLWCNGQLLLNGVIRQGVGRKAPFAFFGDGSGQIDGVARFHSLVIGTP